jgi:hypothetical protein
MVSLQGLFDRLVGIANYETELRDKAHRVYCTPAQNLFNLEKPACWRRPVRILVRRRS